MYSINKNSYLHNYFKSTNPRVINRSLQKAWSYNNLDEGDNDLPFNRLTSEQPCIPVQNIDVTRRPLGFGRTAMTKLRQELHSKNPFVVVAAIESICDLIHDSERAFEAINLKVIQRLVGLIDNEDPIIRERTIRTLAIFARLAAGREEITSNIPLMVNIVSRAEDECLEIRIQTAALLEMLARFWQAADVLISYNFIHILLSNLLDEHKEIVLFHLQTLQSLMYGLHGKMNALREGGYEIFINLLNDEENLSYHEIIAETLNCLALLTSTCEGQKLSRSFGLLKIAIRFLLSHVPAIYTNAAHVVMFCTVSTKQKNEAATISLLPKYLVALSKNSLERSAQIYSIKALTNICEHPEIRKLAKKNYYMDISNIRVDGDEDIKKFKDILMAVLGWVSVSST